MSSPAETPPRLPSGSVGTVVTTAESIWKRTESSLAAAENAGIGPLRLILPVWIMVTLYGVMLLSEGGLLKDPDTFWHIATGRWILQNLAVPHQDPFSQTMQGAPWIAKEWLSQVLYASAFSLAGWTGVAALAAASIALAFGLLMRSLLDEIRPSLALTFIVAASALSAPHFLARPHALALPLMVVWAAGLIRASGSGRPPPYLLLPVVALWANLHGGFTLGLALLAPLAVEAVLTSRPDEKLRTGVHWAAFAALACLAASITPYGPESMLVTHRILALGEMLNTIGEWRPQDFGSLDPFEICLLLGIGAALHRGIRLPPVRIVLLLGLLHLALRHVRNTEVLALLGPLVLARPVAAQVAPAPVWSGLARLRRSSPSLVPLLAAAAVLFAATLHLRRALDLQPAARMVPADAVEAVRAAGLSGPVLNDYDFGGYLIFAGIAPFIDGRGELYKAPFTLRQYRAVSLVSVDELLTLLDEHRIQWTLLAPSRPAVSLLDRLPAWRRLYSDDNAVVHVRGSQ